MDGGQVRTGWPLELQLPHCYGICVTGLRHTRLLVFLTPQAKGKVQGTPLVLVRVQQFSTMGLLVVWTAGKCGQVGGGLVVPGVVWWYGA
eukprot:g75407.t1